MERKLALLLVIPVMGLFSVPALAGARADDGNAHLRHAKHELVQEHNSGRAVHFARVHARGDEDRNHGQVRHASHVTFFVADDDSGGRDGSDDRRRGSDDRRGDDRRGDRDGNYGNWRRDGDRRGGDRRGGDDRYRGDRGRDRYRRDPWHRERYEHGGHIYWRFNIRLFHRYDLGAWRSGYWYRGWYNDRWGWWWVVGGIWYYYPAPIYPYPNPYVPGAVVVVNNQPETPTPPAEAPPQFWYHCSSPEGYYPYVPECSSGWRKVAATSSSGTMPANPPTQSPASPPPPANPPSQSQPPAQSPAPVQYWYHCKSPEGYYPYVKTCPGGWERVPAKPPSTGGSKPTGGG